MNARRLYLAVVASLCALGAALAVSVAPAGAVLPAQFGEAGELAGQFEGPTGIAVDQTSQDVYLMDRGNQRVDEFTGEGQFLRAWGWGVHNGADEFQICGPGASPPTKRCQDGIPRHDQGGVADGAGQFDYPEGNGVIAVDNASGDPLDMSVGDVYVADIRNGRVEKFGPNGEFLAALTEHLGRPESIAVGATGTLFVGEAASVQEFSSEGTYEMTLALEGGSGSVKGLAVDAAGDLIVNAEDGSVREYSESGTLLQTLVAEGASSIALGSHEELFASVGRESIRMLEFAPSGEEIASFDTTVSNSKEIPGRYGLAFGDALGGLYVATQIYEPETNSTTDDVGVVAPPLGREPYLPSVSVSEVQPTGATLQARIDPENHATSYRFEYGQTEAYGSSVPVPDGSLAASFEEETVALPIAKLRAGTTYHYRLVASSECEPEAHPGIQCPVHSEDRTFSTLPAVSIDSEYATAVASTSATLGAQFNPLGAPATYTIEYGATTAYGHMTSPASLSPVSTDVGVSAHVDGLEPDTLYHYRVVAHDEREGQTYTVEGADEAFTTQPAGAPFALPDGRAWEQVSPVNKHGAQIFELPRAEENVYPMQASLAGDAIAYTAGTPTESNPTGYLAFTQVLSRHGVDGWTSQDLATPNALLAGAEINYMEFPIFSEDLSGALVEQLGADAPLLSPLASELTPYVRRQSACESQASASECYTPLITGKQGDADVPAGTHFAYPVPSEIDQELNLEGATGDLSHVVFGYEHHQSRYYEEPNHPTPESASLTETPASTGGLYEWSASEPPAKRLRLVSVLPDGKAAEEDSELGGDVGGVLGLHTNGRGAIAANGSRIFWSGSRGNGESLHVSLYMRDFARGEKGETLEIGEPEPGEETEAGSALYQSTASDGSKVFFTDSGRLIEGASNDSFYECEIVEVAGKLKCRYTDLTPSGGATKLELGSNADGSYVYFATTKSEALLQDNLYVRHEGVTKLIAEDVQPGEPYDFAEGTWEQKEMRMSPSGRFAAFLSKAPLTGYDNVDLATGQPDSEVFVYDAQTGDLACASCNPSGARPVHGGAWVPGWTTYAYQSAYLSNSGRLFFNTAEALVAQDINGVADVYEWEPAGVGSCTVASSTYSPASGGCDGLISSGTSSEASTFVDASESGDDVFFLTLEKLVKQDTDTSFDLYDAHVCGSGWQCASPPAAARECTTTDACRAAPLSQPEIYGAPSSATFTGAGNVSSSPPASGKTVKSKSAAKLRAEKLAKALRACARKPKRKRRACRRSARAKYAISDRGVRR